MNYNEILQSPFSYFNILYSDNINNYCGGGGDDDEYIKELDVISHVFSDYPRQQ